jgi:hypothetical protein
MAARGVRRVCGLIRS